MHYDDPYVLWGQTYRAPPPPTSPPPPSTRAMRYATVTESPYLRSVEVERAVPEHVPQRSFFDISELRRPTKYM